MRRYIPKDMMTPIGGGRYGTGGDPPPTADQDMAGATPVAEGIYLIRRIEKAVGILRNKSVLDQGWITRQVSVGLTPTLLFQSPFPRSIIITNPNGIPTTQQGAGLIDAGKATDPAVP